MHLLLLDFNDLVYNAMHIACGFEGGRSANSSEKVSFFVKKTEKGVRVMVKGQLKTKEVTPLTVLKGPINETGNLSNRLRAVLNAYPSRLGPCPPFRAAEWERRPGLFSAASTRPHGSLTGRL